MSALDLIQQYEQAAAAEAAAKQQQQDQVITRGREFFLANCATWLGPVADDIQQGELTHYSQTSWNDLQITYRLPVQFMGICGVVEQKVQVGAAGKYSWTNAKLDFGYLAQPDGEAQKHVWTTLGSDEKAQAVVPSAQVLGEVLSLVAKHVPVQQRIEAKQVARRRKEAVEFEHVYRHEIDKRAAEYLAEFPDLELEIRAAAERAHKKYMEAEQAQKAEEELQQAIRDERHRLEEVAAAAWTNATPFTIYMITYGAKAEEDGQISQEMFTLTEEPAATGYYSVFTQGTASRQIKPRNVISTERIIINSESDAPYELKRYVLLTSTRLPRAQVWTYLPPAEVGGNIIDKDIRLGE